MRSADHQVAALARRQRGLVTAEQLDAAGLSRFAVSRRVSAGRLHRVHAKVYAVGFVPTAPLVREAAALLAAGRSAVLSHRSAAVVRRLLPPVAALPIDVTIARERSLRLPGIRTHRPRTPLAPHEIIVVDGLRTTAPARTLVDLAAVLGPAELAKAVDEAYARGLVRPGALVVPEGARGATRLRAVLEGRGTTRSGPERRFVALVRRAGLPKPDTNTRLAGHEVDAVWWEQRVAVEIDTLATHAAEVLSDRAKDLALREAGFTPLRFTDVQVDDQPERVLADLVRALHAHA